MAAGSRRINEELSCANLQPRHPGYFDRHWFLGSGVIVRKTGGQQIHWSDYRCLHLVDRSLA
jgi:hypothetical protein